MWNLPIPPQADAIASSDEMISYASGTEASTIELNELYREYTSLFGRPDESLRQSNISDDILDFCKRAYALTYKDERFEGVRSKLMSEVDECPYCGISAPMELDHHLPQSRYHALTIYHHNLVPVCQPCNKAKGALASTDPREHFIHPYLEPLPEGRFFTAKVEIDDDVLITTFKICSETLPSIHKSRLHFQIRRLNLPSRYRKAINTFLFDLHLTFRVFETFEPCGDLVRSFLAKATLDYDESYGPNHWRTALLYALKENREFCNGGFKRVFQRIRERRRLTAH